MPPPFGRLPAAGRCKSRLAASVGGDAAAGLYARLLERTLAAGARAGRFTRRVVAVADAGDVARMRVWVAALRGGALRGRYEVVAQRQGALGERLESALADEFKRAHEEGEDGGYGRCAVVVGSDAPGLSAAVLDAAAGRLLDGGEQAAEAVLGPAADGGYYLLGLTRPVPEAFDGVPWSTAEVAAVTRRKLEAAGARLAEASALPTLRDVDDWRSLGEWAREARAGEPEDVSDALLDVLLVRQAEADL